ncbi:MAG TPA: hypothetical protein VGP93_04170 [Polyangiaceae bacterium]|nr:hypothetical protein [Polyangiaceae bacterium]
MSGGAANTAGTGGAATAGTGGSTSSAGTSAGGNGGATAGTGGTTSTAGSTNAGGEGGTAPHIVEACPTGDNAPSNVGEWEEITPPEIDGVDLPGGAIVVNPKDTRIVYAGSANHKGLYKSTDCGASFTHINTGENGAHIDSGCIWDMVINPVDPDILYVIEGYGDGGLWKTTNGGVDWVNTTPGDSEVGQTATYNFTSIVGMDVTNPDHLVLTFHSGCGGDYSPNCEAETTDGGETWRLFKSTVGGEGVGVIVLADQTWVAANQQTTDGGANWHSITGSATHWQAYQSPSSGAFYIGTMNGILKSTNGTDWAIMPEFTQPVQGITGDGTNIYAGQQWGTSQFQIPEDDPASFVTLPTTDGDSDGPYFMSYDPDHHILYASEFQSGHWRMLTE